MHTKHSAPSTNCVKPHFHAVSVSSATWLEAIYSCCPVCPANISAYLIAILAPCFSHAQASNKAGILNLRRKTFMRQNISAGYSWSWSARIQPFTLPHGLVSRRRTDANVTEKLYELLAHDSGATVQNHRQSQRHKYHYKILHAQKNTAPKPFAAKPGLFTWSIVGIELCYWAISEEFGRDYCTSLPDAFWIAPQSAFPLWVSSFNLIICGAGADSVDLHSALQSCRFDMMAFVESTKTALWTGSGCPPRNRRLPSEAAWPG